MIPAIDRRVVTVGVVVPAFALGFLVAALARPRTVTHMQTTTLAGRVVPAACLDALTAARRFFRSPSKAEFAVRVGIFETTAAGCRTVTATHPPVAAPPTCRAAIAVAHELATETQQRDEAAELGRRFNASAAQCRAGG